MHYLTFPVSSTSFYFFIFQLVEILLLKSNLGSCNCESCLGVSRDGKSADYPRLIKFLSIEILFSFLIFFPSFSCTSCSEAYPNPHNFRKIIRNCLVLVRPYKKIGRKKKQNPTKWKVFSPFVFSWKASKCIPNNFFFFLSDKRKFDMRWYAFELQIFDLFFAGYIVLYFTEFCAWCAHT